MGGNFGKLGIIIQYCLLVRFLKGDYFNVAVLVINIVTSISKVVMLVINIQRFLINIAMLVINIVTSISKVAMLVINIQRFLINIAMLVINIQTFLINVVILSTTKSKTRLFKKAGFFGKRI
jgi:hypothetical protein